MGVSPAAGGGEESAFDVVIVGSGVAGLVGAVTAARTADPGSARVALVTSSDLVGGCTRWAQGGIAAALGDDDSPDLHARDTLDAGRGLADETAVRVLCEEGPERVRELAALGVAFDRDASGRFRLGREAAHSRARVAHAGGDATGYGIAIALAERVRALAPAVTVLERHLAVSLLRGPEGVCAGVLAVDLTTGELRRLTAPATLLASGGAGRLWRRTTNPEGAVGAAVAMTYGAGAEVESLELMQFHPTALAVEGAAAFLVSEAVRGEGALVVDAEGTRFLLDEDPRGELAPRDAVASAIWRRLATTGATAVFLDCRPIGERVHERFPTVSATLHTVGIDMARDLVPIAPAAHYSIGGVRTDLDGASTLAGLYAAGEAASTRVHGANRLASNSLLEGAVFGRRAALAALRHAAECRPPSRVEPVEPVATGSATNSVAAAVAETRLREAMWAGCGLIRDEAGLGAAAAAAAETAEVADGLSFPASATLRASARAASLVCRSALLRTESRGAHRRSDFPQTADVHQGTWVLSSAKGPRLDRHA